MTDTKPKKPRTRLIAVIGIDTRKGRSEPGDPVELPEALAKDYQRRGKVRKEKG